MSSLKEEFKCSKVRLEISLAESRDPEVAQAAPTLLMGKKWSSAGERRLRNLGSAKEPRHSADVWWWRMMTRAGVEMHQGGCSWKAGPVGGGGEEEAVMEAAVGTGGIWKLLHSVSLWCPPISTSGTEKIPHAHSVHHQPA